MSDSVAAMYEPRLTRRKFMSGAFHVIAIVMTLFAVMMLGVLLYSVWRIGSPMLSWAFITNSPSRLSPEKSGVLPALIGTAWLMLMTAAISIPVGIGAAIYLQEYAGRGRFARLVQVNLANLAGVPSIVYGILGLAIFVRGFGEGSFLGFGRSLISGALTMSLLILPTVIIASREALSAVPRTIREAAYALGASRWQMIWSHVLPAALPGMLTGIILSMSRAIGETAPLIMIGAATWVSSVPGGLPSDYDPTWEGRMEWLHEATHGPFTVLPLQIYSWASDPQEIFRELSAAAIVVLLGVLLSMNAIAVLIRAWWQRSTK